MPQTHNPTGPEDDSPLGDASHYRKALNASVSVRRRMKTVKDLEAKRLTVQLNSIAGHSEDATHYFTRLEERMRENARHVRARQLVTESLSYGRRTNYLRALREPHLEKFRQRQFDDRLEYVLKRMEPTYRRSLNNMVLQEKARKDLDEGIAKMQITAEELREKGQERVHTRVQKRVAWEEEPERSYPDIVFTSGSFLPKLFPAPGTRDTVDDDCKSTKSAKSYKSAKSAKSSKSSKSTKSHKSLPSNLKKKSSMPELSAKTGVAKSSNTAKSVQFVTEPVDEEEGEYGITDKVQTKSKLGMLTKSYYSLKSVKL